MALALLIVALVGIGAIATVSVWAVVRARPDMLRDPAEVPPSRAAVVFGAAVYSDGTLAAVTDDRVQTGIDLYRAGLVKKLLLSGDHGRGAYDEVYAMRRRALEAGVPAEDIFLDHAGFSTYDTVVRAERVFQVDSAVLVTQEFHLPRALMIARLAGLEAVGFPADRRRYAGAPYWRLREALARVKDLAKGLLGSAPRYLGVPVPITADGRITLDDVQRRKDAER